MRRILIGQFLVAALLAGIGAQAASVEELEARSKECKAQDPGCEEKAVVAFWGETSYMAEWLGPDPRNAEALKILAEINTDGTMGELRIAPVNVMAKCIAKHVRDHKFPKPSATYVLKIDLTFNQ